MVTGHMIVAFATMGFVQRLRYAASLDLPGPVRGVRNPLILLLRFCHGSNVSLHGGAGADLNPYVFEAS